MQIFISFASEQREVAELIAVVLRDRGYKVFFSKDTLPAAESFDVRIEKAVKSSDLFLFLISPESVTRGKYTLTELSFAREKWSGPGGHVLPVMIAPTPISAIPVYLRSVSIFEPEGNVAAETAARADKLLKKTSQRAVAYIALAGVVTGLLSYFSLLYAPNILKFSFIYASAVMIGSYNGQSPTNLSDVTILPGIYFGGLIAFCAWRFGLRDKLHVIVIVIFTTMSWVLAYNTTVMIFQQINQYTRVITASAASAPIPPPVAPITSDPGAGNDGNAGGNATSNDGGGDSNGGGDSTPPADPSPISETMPLSAALSGMVGGLVGGLGTLFGVAIASVRMRKIEKLLPAAVVAVAIGSLVELVPQLKSYGSFGYIAVFVLWQSMVAGMIARVLCATEAEHE